MEFGVDYEEVVTTEPESDEADEKFYMNRLLMLGRAGALCTPPLHTPPRSTSHCGISPEIGLLAVIGVTRPVASSQIRDSLLTDSLSQSNTMCKEDEGSTKMDQSKGRPATVTMTSESKKINTNANQIQSYPTTHPKCLFTHGLSQCVCSGLSAVDSQRSVREHAQAMSKIKKDKGSISKSRSKKARCRKLSPEKGICGRAIKKPTSGKQKVLRSQDICRRNKFGETHLHLAVMKGDFQSVKDIIKVGASVNLADNAGWTPLHEAVLGRNYKVAKTLIKAGARVNSVGLEGITPLHDAVQLGDFKFVQLLLKCGADPLFKNQKGDNAIDLSQDKNIEKLLRQYPAKACRVTRQSAAKDEAEKDQKTSEAEHSPAVCPDSEDAAKVHDTFSANHEGVVGETIMENDNTINEELLGNQIHISHLLKVTWIRNVVFLYLRPVRLE
ncbi:hypothetical protein QTP86_006652 [Hemibagrus guttatus]|nr:hypothetical protein QTP86_006652 [Hemibagrus guttatus]